MSLHTLTIRCYGDPCLRQKSAPVQDVGPAERVLIQAMLKTMHANKGVGLAAPQVGVNRQIFVADIGRGPLVVVNPKILTRRGSAVMEEGCLSIPDVTVKVRRPLSITAAFTDEKNQRVTAEMTELMARVFLHETDHLFGRLIVDYATDKEKAAFQPKLERLEALTKKAARP